MMRRSESTNFEKSGLDQRTPVPYAKNSTEDEFELLPFDVEITEVSIRMFTTLVHPRSLACAFRR